MVHINIAHVNRQKHNLVVTITDRQTNIYLAQTHSDKLSQDVRGDH